MDKYLPPIDDDELAMDELGGIGRVMGLLGVEDGSIVRCVCVFFFLIFDWIDF